MAALVAVMVLVAFGTFDWHSDRPGHAQADARRRDHRHGRSPSPWSWPPATSPSAWSSARITAMVIFARRVAHLVEVTAVTDPDGTQVVYAVTGELFFASSNDLVYQFDYADDPDNVVIDLTDAHIWDASTVAALDAVTTKYASRGKTVEIVGLNADSARRHGRLSGELAGSH